ncbi:hypothetical protein NB636_02970 [Oxalobacter aliiformigenes]|uniref:hypothetical protein n=1 Tax=Oxalobacter aliiformigenes TaxID=2946593 RepID=UPI0022B069B3|nr:hypothetical protein [Oxalobacter aliiformigenes]MCZ4064491.1 hypothetical protein [Oxalobacter aliiformigenes]WAV99830.1 hypothetical protein NB636_02970 [Oxalobacter aliiformigenes]
MKRDGSRAKVYSGCNLMVLERTSRPDMRQVPWGGHVKWRQIRPAMKRLGEKIVLA